MFMKTAKLSNALNLSRCEAKQILDFVSVG